MREKWILKHSLTDLRKNKGLSMEALSQLSYTTATTIFRIEKTGVIADLALAEQLASIFDIPFEDFCSDSFASRSMEKAWKTNLESPYLTSSENESSYYLAFVRRYTKQSKYSVISPTMWCRYENGKEYRRLRVFTPEGIKEHLENSGIRCAVVHDVLTLIYFFYGIPSNEERAALIRTDIADTVYPRMVKEYVCNSNSLPNHFDFKDMVEVNLHGDISCQ